MFVGCMFDCNLFLLYVSLILNVLDDLLEYWILDWECSLEGNWVCWCGFYGVWEGRVWLY